MPDVSVIIVNWNTKDLLKACLASVFADVAGREVEVLVIDNGSSDGSAEMVEREFPRVKLQCNQMNEGFAKPNNDGMRVAGGTYILLLNSDTVVRSGAVAALVSFMDRHPDAGACGPRLVNPDGSTQRSVKGFPTLWTHLCDMLFLDKAFPRSRLLGRGEMAYFSYDSVEEVDHVMAAAFLVRRGVLEGVGLFDEHFTIYYNDMDWCYRIRKRGWKIWYVPTAAIVHYRGQTVNKLNRDFACVEEMYNNVMLYYLKHHGRWSVVVYRLLLALGFVVRSAGWNLYTLVNPSERIAHMARFSLRALRIGLAFWKLPEISPNVGASLHG